MERQKLINYSYMYNGEYMDIIHAIKNKEKCEDIKIDNCITIFDDLYPKEFLDLKFPPLVLYYKGNLNLLKEDKIGIVGSRLACDYALQATKLLVKKNLDKTIVSGLALGIDACAHLNACKTIGILGCGIDYIYPKANYNLYKQLEENGLILSEYPGLTKPLGYHFPFRNRLIASLSNCVYIMQSTINSGTMTTINEALELGKDIKVLPYDIFNQFGENNNRLILEGANIITNDEIAI